MSKAEMDAYMALVNEVAAAKVRFSQEWQLARVKVGSDMAATQVAIERTKAELTVLEARLRMSERMLTC